MKCFGFMEKVINIEERLEHKKQKKQLEQNRGKIEAIQKIVRCSSCHFRCVMCGHHLQDSDSSDSSPSSSFGFAFCKNCGAEFEDFLAVSRGKSRPDVLWHNREWLKMWSAWLDYRQAMNGFVDSPEFKSLLEEIDKQS